MNPTAPNPKPPTVPVTEAAKVAQAANLAGHGAGWKTGILLAGGVGLMLLIVLAVVSQTSQTRAVEKTSETAFSAGATAAQAQYEKEARTL